ncbi:MAG: septum formation initiator family protein [Proteobacteria bacterium]|nr:septum formation initiator family protein [Pseudomonadota bacterium]
MMNKDHRNIIVVGLAITALLLFYTVFSERGVLKGRQLTLQRDALIAKSKVIKAKNAQLTEELKRLNNDLKTIEKIARSQLDLVKENEILYKFTD